MLTRCSILSFLLVARVFSQAINTQPVPPPLPPSTVLIPNGISVGRPKIFDNRSLTLMLENLNETLKGIQGQFILPASVNTATTNSQGSRSTDSSTSITLTPLPIPGQKQEVVSNTGIVDSAGKSLPDTTKTTTTSDRSTIAPAIPQLDAATTGQAGFSPTFGANAADLLTDQVNLTYQILNLRMVLERSLSDRLLSTGGSRLQAVMGFNVTIDPPRTANDAVAVVEITVEPDGGALNTNGMSLVALMPQEKTYNSSNLSTKTRQFGGSAVVKVVQVGINTRRRAQTFYLYRDTDTVSYERMVNGANTLQFGWMFRPVLGRRSVSPGLRQMFAVVSLPAEDSRFLGAMKLKATVKTYWKKYDSSTQTGFLAAEANRAKVAGFAMSLGLASPQIFGAAWTNSALYSGIDVKSTYQYQRELRPRILNAVWRPTGPKTATVTVQGENFFTGTQVLIGDQAYTGPANGFTIKSSETVEINTSIEALASGPGVLSGRYGGSLPLIIPDPAGASPNGINLSGVDLGPSLGGRRKLKLILSGPTCVSELPQDQLVEKEGTNCLTGATKLMGPTCGLDAIKTPSSTLLKNGLTVPAEPIITINGKLVAGPFTFREEGGKVVADIQVSDSLLENGTGTIKISWPFLDPQKWTKSIEFTDQRLMFDVMRLGQSSVLIRSFDRFGFTSSDPTAKNFCWQMISGEEAQSIPTEVCVGDAKVKTSIKPSSHLVGVAMEKPVPDKVILVSPNNSSFVLDVPKDKKPEAGGPIEVNQNDSVWVPVSVKASAEGLVAEANGRILATREKDGEKDSKAKTRPIEVQLTREVTAAAGILDLTIADKEKKLVGAAKVLVICSLCEVHQRR